MRRARVIVWLGTAFVAVLATLAAGSAAITYDNEAADMGIAFQQAGEVHLDLEDINVGFPEIIGGGACWADLDGDGLDDLYLVSQQFNPMNNDTRWWSDRLAPTSRLYLNRGDGAFDDVTEAAGVASGRFGQGCSAADYDGDGDNDLFVSVFADPLWGGNHLYRNEGSTTFVDVAAEAGVLMLGECGDLPCNATNSAWADYDGDGDLDLYVATYVETELDDTEAGPGRHIAQTNHLFRNEGDGTFTEVAEDAGVAGNPTDDEGAKSFGAVWFDHDLDGDLDLFVANDMTPDDFYVNNGDGTFTERSNESGLADPRAGMGLAIADYDNDAYPDVFITHYAFQYYGFYHNQRDGTFDDRSGEDDLDSTGENVGWGTAFADYDRDGDLDLFSVMGHTQFDFDPYAQPTLAWRNDPEPLPDGPGDRLWVDVSAELGPGLAETGVSRGAGFADYDLDGDIDIAVNNNGNGTAQLLRASGVENHYLNVRVVQGGMNAQAIGAKVKLEAAGLPPQHREVQAGSSFLSQNTLQLEFGLADATMAERITVTWPDGGTTIVEDVAADQTVRIERATGAVVLDVLAPRTSIATDVGETGPGWYTSPVTATLSATDLGAPTTSGVALTEFASGDEPLAPYDGRSFAFAGEGVHLLRARSEDGVGNVEPVRRIVVGIDATAPEARHEVAGAPGAGGWFAEPVTVTLAADDATSGVDRLLFRIDGADWRVYRGPFRVAGDGEHVVDYQAFDRAGNAGALGSFAVRIDATPPEAQITAPLPGSVQLFGRILPATAPTGPAVVVTRETFLGDAGELLVTATAEDAVSGPHHVVFLVDGAVAATDREGPEWAWTWQVSRAEPGLHELAVIAVDAAGNVDLASMSVLVAPLLEDEERARPRDAPAPPVAARMVDARRA